MATKTKAQRLEEAKALLAQEGFAVEAEKKFGGSRTYLSSANSRMITVPDKYIPLVGGVNEKKSMPPIEFKGGRLTTRDPEIQAIIESQADFSDKHDLDATNPETGRPVTIIPEPDMKALASKAAA